VGLRRRSTPRVPPIGVLTGGTCRAELLDHDAFLIYESVDELRADLKELSFAQISPSGAAGS
jgi:hypothetical protein